MTSLITMYFFLALFVQNNTMICLNGQVLKRDSIHNSSNARFLMDSMFDFAERLNSLHLSDPEIGLFSSIVVIAAGKCLYHSYATLPLTPPPPPPSSPSPSPNKICQFSTVGDRVCLEKKSKILILVMGGWAVVTNPKGNGI